MAQADQSFPVLAYPILRLKDREWLPTLFLRNDNVMEMDLVIRCFEDSLLCRKPESPVRTMFRAENCLRTKVRTETP